MVLSYLKFKYIFRKNIALTMHC